MSRIPNPREEEDVPSLWLILDEVVDPQNFGALLRSAYFLGGGSPTDGNIGSTIGIIVCSKNSGKNHTLIVFYTAEAYD